MEISGDKPHSRKKDERSKADIIHGLMTMFGLTYKQSEKIYDAKKGTGFFNEPWFNVVIGIKN